MKTRKNQYEMWREKALPEDVQRRADGFANADESADGCERAFRAGWILRKMMETRWDKERMEWTKTA